MRRALLRGRSRWRFAVTVWILAALCLYLLVTKRRESASLDPGVIQGLKGFSPLSSLSSPTTKAARKMRNCTQWFEETVEGNLRVIANYPMGNADRYLPFVGGNLTEPREMMSFPVIVTAADSRFYGVTEGLLKSVHEILMPKYNDLRIVYYDLGLTDTQVETLRKHCRCEVRTFPFAQFPSHVTRLQTYAWKPLIIHKTLMDFGAIWWLDSSVRFTTKNLDRAITYARENGILFFTYAQVLSVSSHTDPQMLHYLGEDVCKFRSFGETEATFGLYHWHNVTRVLVRSWAACALNKACIAPPRSESKIFCRQGDGTDGQCHRFDQSMLSILTRRLYHDKNDYPEVKIPFRIHVIRRGESIEYFPR